MRVMFVPSPAQHKLTISHSAYSICTARRTSDTLSKCKIIIMLYNTCPIYFVNLFHSQFQNFYLGASLGLQATFLPLPSHFTRKEMERGSYFCLCWIEEKGSQKRGEQERFGFLTTRYGWLVLHSYRIVYTTFTKLELQV